MTSCGVFITGGERWEHGVSVGAWWWVVGYCGLECGQARTINTAPTRNTLPYQSSNKKKTECVP